MFSQRNPMRCNGCLLDPSRTEADMAITNCGHLFCARCVEAAMETRKCGICGNPHLQYVALGKEAKPDIKLWFQDISSEINRIRSIFSFQAFQYRSLISHLKSRVAKLEQQLVEARRFTETRKSRLHEPRQEMTFRNAGSFNRSNEGYNPRNYIPPGRLSLPASTGRYGRINLSGESQDSRQRSLYSNPGMLRNSCVTSQCATKRRNNFYHGNDVMPDSKRVRNQSSLSAGATLQGNGSQWWYDYI